MDMIRYISDLLRNAGEKGDCCFVDSAGNCHDMNNDYLYSFFLDNKGQGFTLDLNAEMENVDELDIRAYHFLGF